MNSIQNPSPTGRSRYLTETSLLLSPKISLYLHKQPDRSDTRLAPNQLPPSRHAPSILHLLPREPQRQTPTVNNVTQSRFPCQKTAQRSRRYLRGRSSAASQDSENRCHCYPSVRQHWPNKRHKPSACTV